MTILLAAVEIAAYLPEGIFGLVIILLISAIVALWKKLDKKDEEVAKINAEHKIQLNEKDLLYKAALDHVLEGLKEANEIVHKITNNISTMNKPVRDDINEHDKRMYTLMTEVKSLIQTLSNGKT